MPESESFEYPQEPQQNYVLPIEEDHLFSLGTRQALRLLDDARKISDSIVPVELYKGCDGISQLHDNARSLSGWAIKGLNAYKMFRAERKLSRAESILGMSLPGWLEKY